MTAYALFAPALPFYTGGVANVPNPGIAVVIAGRQYAIDLTKYVHRGLPTFRDSVVDTGVPDDSLFNTDGGWPRYQISFHHGAGQRVRDLGDDFDKVRFLASRGIDPWTRYQAELLPATESVHDATASTIHMTSTATHVYHSDGNDVYRSADLVTWDAITGMAAEAVKGMTSDGVDAYIITTDHIYRVDVAGVGATDITTAAPTNDFEAIAFVANKLLVSDGNILREVVTGGSWGSAIFTHYQTEFAWRVMFQVGSRIYVGGYSGNRTELYSLTTTSVGALAISAEAASFFAGELLRCAQSYGGSVILGTSKGVRFASVGGDGTLQYGPLIEDAGDVHAVAAEGRFAWFEWQDFPDAGCGLGRLALDDFVDVLQPAYASDVFTTAADATITAIVRFANKTIFAVAEEGVFATTSSFVAEGWIDSGDIYFGTVEDKSLMEVRARVDPLGTGEAVSVEVVDGETGDPLGDGVVDDDGSVGVAAALDGTHTNRLQLRVVLAGNASSSPTLRHWRATAYPIGPNLAEWEVPLIIHSRVLLGDGEGEIVSYDPFDELARFTMFRETQETILYQEGTHAYRVRVANFAVSPAKWRDGGDWFEMTLTVRFLTV